ncbi:MAG: PLDc_N domain-containing protein [Flavobacteriales bacterium]|nr:MAG: PLDc_N domain-containing protein [Flavobacteriales bacterium]
MLLEIFGLGTAEIGIILAIAAVPLLLIIYCIVDIIRSTFNNRLMKLLMLALVLFAPFLGSIVYLIVRREFVKSNDDLNKYS